MSSGYTGSTPELYGGPTTGSRAASIRNALIMAGESQGLGGAAGIYRFQNNQNINNLIQSNPQSQPQQQQPQQQQFTGMGIDALSGQIGGHRRMFDLQGTKRTLAEFQSYPQIHNQMASSIPLFHQQHLQQQQQMLVRSVKPRMMMMMGGAGGGLYHNTASPVSTLSPPIDLSDPPFSARYGVPLYQHVRPISGPNTGFDFTVPGIGLSNLGPSRGPESKPVVESASCKVTMTLQELEKQLLADEDDGEAVSVVTNSDWSVEYQKLVGPGPTTAQQSTAQQQQQPQQVPSAVVVSPSPTSSSSSASSSKSSSSSPPSAKQLIAEAAVAIDEGRRDAALEILNRLAQVGSTKGNSEQRVAFYMCNALRCRAWPEEHAPPVDQLCGAEHMGLMHMMYDLSPCFRFGILAATYVILETIASEKGNMVHVIDFDVGDGGQYVNLLQTVAKGRSRATSDGIAVSFIPLRITAVNTEPNGSVEAARDRLLKVAEQLGVNLRFDVVALPIHELTREALQCSDDEAVVVNFVFRLYRVPDESVSMENFRDELLRRVKGLRPRVVMLVEQEMSLNTAPFLARVTETSGYYGAVFESMDATRPRDDPERLRMEAAMGRKIANAVACEGRDRLERCEVFGKWHARMGMAGFELKSLSHDVMRFMQEKLNSTWGGNPGFTVKEEGGGGIAFGWNGRTITVASAWR